MSIVVLRGNNLEIQLGLVSLLNLHSNHLQITNCYPHSKQGQYIYSNHLTNLEIVIL